VFTAPGTSRVAGFFRRESHSSRTSFDEVRVAFEPWLTQFGAGRRMCSSTKLAGSQPQGHGTVSTRPVLKSVLLMPACLRVWSRDLARAEI
jgi:hypothetical protein